MKRLKSAIWASFVLAVASIHFAGSSEACEAGHVDRIGDSRASVPSFFFGGGNFPSLESEARRLITSGLQNLEKKESDCDKHNEIFLVFRAVPYEFISSNHDMENCERLLLETTKSPLLFPALNVRNVDEVIQWFSSFAQGRGERGRELYRKCPGSCSPQYHISVKPRNNDELQLTPMAICGQARDKTDNTYELSVEIHLNEN